MARQLATKTITQEDLEDYLASEDDFAFELDVLKICQKHSPHVAHGGTYQDPISGQNRQFDIRIWITDQDRTLALAVECKNLKTYFPLLVSQVPRLEEEAFHGSIEAGKIGFAIRVHEGENTMYPEGQPVGKSTTQVGKPLSMNGTSFVSGDGEAYDKWAQAIASAEELVTHASKKSRHATLDYSFASAGCARWDIVDGAVYSVRGTRELSDTFKSLHTFPCEKLRS